MCIICTEFNKYKDIQDSERMIEAARRESAFISEEHLAKLEDKLKNMKVSGKVEELEIEEETE